MRIGLAAWGQGGLGAWGEDASSSTQVPPKIKMRLPTVAAVCPSRSIGAAPLVEGLLHVRLSTSKACTAETDGISWVHERVGGVRGEERSGGTRERAWREDAEGGQ